MREKVGREGRRNNGQTAWQRIVGHLASRGTGAPSHLTLEPDAVREGGCTFMAAWMKEEKKASEHR